MEKKFYEITHSDIYVDKTELLTYTNSVLQTLQKYICISRPRRFGKSITASMIAAYYSRGCDAKELFSPYKIARNLDFDTYRNKYNTLFLNMQEFLSQTKNIYELLDRMKRLVLRDLKRNTRMLIILMIQILLNPCRMYIRKLTVLLS